MAYSYLTSSYLESGSAHGSVVQHGVGLCDEYPMETDWL